MTTEDDGRQIMRHQRMMLRLTQQDVAKRVGVSRAYITMLESGRSPLGNVPAHTLARIADVLQLTERERIIFLGSTDSSLRQQPAQDLTTLDDSDIETNTDTRRKLLDFLEAIPTYAKYELRWPLLASWALARLFSLRLWHNNSILMMRPIAVRFLKKPHYDEMVGIVLLDMADLLVSNGDLAQAELYCRQALEVAHRVYALYQNESEDTRARHAMGIGRALLVQQNIANLRGITEDAQRFHHESSQYLTSSDDAYGWSKTYYLRAILAFHRGDLDDAETFARQSYQYGLKTPYHRHPLWKLRDGDFLGHTWWHLQSLCMLIDVLACKGAYATTEFQTLYQSYLSAERNAWWARHIPSLAPRYRWVANWSTHPPERLARELTAWIVESRRSGFVLYVADILISQGDLLLVRRNPTAALKAYRQAEETARAYGYTLLEETARNRQQGINLPPALTLLSQGERRSSS